MTYSIEEIKKMLEGISPWPWAEYEPDAYQGRGVEDVNGSKIPNHDKDVPFIAAAPQIIYELVEEREAIQKMQITKLYMAAKCALEHLESSGRREDIQKMLREVLG